MSNRPNSPAASGDAVASRREIFAVAAAAAGATAFAASAQAQPAPQHVRIFNPPTMAKPNGYSHVAEVTAGRTVYIAGQIAVDPSGKLVGVPGDFRAQATQVFENLKAALASVGGSFANVVKLNGYLTDAKAQLPILREVRDGYLSRDTPPPPSTVVQVVALAREGLMIEVEVVAVLPPSA
jgi:enamine deaminase RidA (YjgF/YER057c/UK114 family)